jgi:hypothetical protein
MVRGVSLAVSTASSSDRVSTIRVSGWDHREAEIPLTLQGQTITRWFKGDRPLLIDFAPYAAYFIRANLFLAIDNLNESVLRKQQHHDLRDLGTATIFRFVKYSHQMTECSASFSIF